MWSAEISAFVMSRLKLQHIGLRGAIKLFKPQCETLSYDLLPTLSCRTQGSLTAPVYEFGLFPFGVIHIHTTFFVSVSQFRVMTLSPANMPTRNQKGIRVDV